MATVTGFTSARMQEIVDDTISNGYINTSGHLILVTYDGTEKDMGPITTFLATTEAVGGVELATNLEAQQGVLNDKAVTPFNLANMIGYRFWQTLKYTSSGSFSKTQYPELAMLRVRLVGGGGAGGAALAATTGNHSKGAGGGGGGYAERILFPGNLADTETVTVGSGGAAGTQQAAGNTGGTSSFGSLVSATGGLGGNIATNQSLMVSAIGGEGGIGTAGDILIKGSGGHMGVGHATLGTGGAGGNSMLGGGAHGTFTPSGGGTLPGIAGGLYGGGGGGAMQNSAAGGTAAGGAGAAGIVLVDLFVK